jgi:hypothetical protein
MADVWGLELLGSGKTRGANVTSGSKDRNSWTRWTTISFWVVRLFHVIMQLLSNSQHYTATFIDCRISADLCLILCSFHIVRFLVVMAASMNMTAFWDTALCCLAETDQIFRGAYCLHNQDDEWENFYLLQRDYTAVYSRRLSSSSLHIIGKRDYFEKIEIALVLSSFLSRV